MAEGALEMECLSLWELCEGNLEGGLPRRGPRRILRKGSGEGYLSLWGFCWAAWGELIYRDFKIWLRGLWRWSLSLSVGAL
jgi:hypothetical protein